MEQQMGLLHSSQMLAYANGELFMVIRVTIIYLVLQPMAFIIFVLQVLQIQIWDLVFLLFSGIKVFMAAVLPMDI